MGPHPPARGRHTNWKQLKRDILPAIGLSPTFRAYLFVGSILAILAFLLYNESVIRQLRDREKSNVDLYAKLISLAPLAADEQSITIFQEISINPSINFPIVVTDYTGRIVHWNNVDPASLEAQDADRPRLWDALTFWREPDSPAAGEDSGDTPAALRQLVREMDAKNEPIPFYPVPEVTGRIYISNGDLIITDRGLWPVQWHGGGLPDAPDTTARARAAVERRLESMHEEVEPLVFHTPVGMSVYAHFDGRNVVVADRMNDVLAWRGPDLPASTDSTTAARKHVAQLLTEMSRTIRPLAFELPAENYIHYGESQLVRRMSLATYIQITALVLFLLVAYMGFRNIKRSVQRSIWVGMAKETAHQLGTPLSSLSGWLELFDAKLHEMHAGTEPTRQHLDETRQMVAEMRRDMARLSQIASRFSQIGSVPELQMGDVVAVLDETVAYFKGRAPQFGHYEIRRSVHGEIPPIPFNPELIGWVFENLFKNAVDALEGGVGTITVDISMQPEVSMVQLAFTDTGRGIAPENAGRIFDPGFSTKKRGWGLGLAFVKRIVEDYHGGQIRLAHSATGQGSRFEVMLPLAGKH